MNAYCCIACKYTQGFFSQKKVCVKFLWFHLFTVSPFLKDYMAVGVIWSRHGIQDKWNTRSHVFHSRYYSDASLNIAISVDDPTATGQMDKAIIVVT